MLFDELTYRDPTSRRKPAKRVPTLTKIQLKMHNSLLRTPGERVKKSWLITKTKTTATILHGLKKEHPFSGDISISLWQEKIDLTTLDD